MRPQKSSSFGLEAESVPTLPMNGFEILLQVAVLASAVRYIRLRRNVSDTVYWYLISQ